jgi:hypothetical protein
MDKHTDKARIARTATGTVTTALAALFMVGAITFGASVLRPMNANHDADASVAQSDGQTDGQAAGNGGGEPGGTGGVDKPDGFDGAQNLGNEDPDWIGVDNQQEPSAEPTDKPADPEPTEKPADPEPTEKPQPSGDLYLEAFVNADSGKIVVKWSPFGGYFEKYKLMRSHDATVTWPGGEDDELVAVIGPDDMTKFYDTSAPCGVEFHYRVFAVKHGEEGYVVLAESNVDGVYRECDSAPSEPAEPVAMGFELWQVDGGVKLHWEACTSDAFAVYKVVRSATNANPVYPLNDGTELLAAIGDQGVTYFFDGNVEPGQTWYYRILALGSGGDGWFVLGQTAALTITVE